MNYRALMSTAAILIVPIAAAAQEQRESVDWSGYYAGVFGGTAEFDAERRDGGSLMTSFSGHGSIQGLVAGYNVQRNDWIYGIEADIAALNWTHGNQDSLSSGTGERFDVTSAASLRGRFGFVQDQTMFFATAGIGHVDRQYTGSGGSELDLSGTGPVAGLGVEHRLDENVSVGLEGLLFFVDESADEHTLYANSSPTASASSELNAGNVGILRARVTYSW
jgi:hypothetical protein